MARKKKLFFLYTFPKNKWMGEDAEAPKAIIVSLSVNAIYVIVILVMYKLYSTYTFENVHITFN